MLRLLLTRALAFALLGLPLFANLQHAARAAELPDGEVDVQTINDTIRGQLISLSIGEGLSIRVEGRGRVTIPVSDLVRLDFPPEKRHSNGRKIVLDMVRGDRLRGSLVEGKGESMVIESSDFGRVPVPLDMVRSIATANAQLPAHRKAAGWFRRQPVDDEDAVLLTNGDILTGYLTEVGPEGIAIEGANGESRVDYRLVVMLRCAPLRLPPLNRMAFVVITADQGRLTMTDMDLNSEQVQARLWFGNEVSLIPNRLRRIEVLGGRWEHLADHEPISYEQVSMLTLHWPYEANKSVIGEPLSVAGQPFDHGIGVHSRSILIFDLAGRYSHFVTSMGLDDNSGDRGDVSVAIVVDGQRHFERSNVKRGELIGPVRLDISKARSLELVCDFGANGDVQDRFDWIEPALIRALNPPPGESDDR